MSECVQFISKPEREELVKIFRDIERIKESISLDHEEFSAINTALYYLKNAIECKEKYY